MNAKFGLGRVLAMGGALPVLVVSGTASTIAEVGALGRVERAQEPLAIGHLAAVADLGADLLDTVRIASRWAGLSPRR